MWKQIYLLTKVQLCNIWGINQIRHGKEKKQKNRLLLLMITFACLGTMFAFYAGMSAYGIVKLGIGELVPAMMLMLVSMIILFFSIYKAGGVLFNMHTYEMLISLPVTPSVIVASRFLYMYVQNLMMGALIMIPASLVLGIMEGYSVRFYVFTVIGTILMPLIPMTIATIIGAVITWISSRMKHKNLVTIILTLGLTIGIIIISFVLPSQMEQNGGAVDMEQIQNLGEIAKDQLYTSYPFAKLYTQGIVEGNLLSLLIFALLSIGIFLATLIMVQWKFVSISTALHSRGTSTHYEIQELSQNSITMALYKKELKRYFSSNIYVMNTLIGYILMVIFAAALFFYGVEGMEEILEMPGIIIRYTPFIIALTCSMTPSTSSSISLEGKTWWMSQSIPITTKQLFDSKILVNLTIALPCYLTAELFLFLAMDLSFWSGIWMILIPLVYLLFSAVNGIGINCKMPIFTWDSETAVVKQSAATLICIIISFLTVLIPIVSIIALKHISPDIIMGITVLVLGTTTGIIYTKNNKLNLNRIE